MARGNSFLTNRRGALAIMAGAAGMSLADLANTLESPNGGLWGGLAALGQAYNVSGELWIGPDSARSNVDANSGRVYLASDTEEIYYGDAGSWTQLGIDVPTLTTTEIDGSYRWGDTVYYNPASRGDYVDGQDALADVPSGGTLIISGSYDVSTEGRILQTDSPVHIRGTGFGDLDGGTTTGTVIDNTAADAPAIEIAASANNVVNESTISDLHITHHGATTAAVLLDAAARTKTWNVSVDCINGGGSNGAKGIHQTGDGSGEAQQCKHIMPTIQGASEHGILIDSNAGGSGNDILIPRIGGGASNAVGIETQARGLNIIGGTVRNNGGTSNGSTLIKFNNSAGNANFDGGTVQGTFMEGPCQTGLEITGSGDEFQDVTGRVRLTLNTGTNGLGTGIVFGDASQCYITAIAEQVSAGGTLCEWTADSAFCTLETVYANSQAPLTVSGSAFLPSMVVRGAVSDSQIANITTASGLAIEAKSTDQNGPVFYNGTDWYSGSFTTYTPT